MPNQYTFAYDSVFDAHVSQQEVYATVVQPVVHSCLSGYNGCIIAYGQTGTGKTFTIEGAHDGDNRGIIPHAADDVRHARSYNDVGSFHGYCRYSSTFKSHRRLAHSFLCASLSFKYTTSAFVTCLFAAFVSKVGI